MSKLPNKRALPSREAGQFKELLNLYESRQLKKGLKTADLILKKFPEHGETLCMKGLVLVHMGRREEGIDLVKKGVRLDLTSHIVWHVFGLIQKGEKNYEEALKSYTQALRFEKENINILRDAASLQTQLRLYDALVETRHTLLRLRPNLRQHWVALSIAHYLNGNTKDAKAVLESYLSTLKNVPPHDVEQSETLLFYITLLEELGEHSEALSVLDSNSRSRAIVDRTAVSETRARLLTKLGTPEAEEAWHTLLERNSDCYDYYAGYLSNKGHTLTEPSPAALQIVSDLAAEFPRAKAPKRLSLNLSTGDEFKARAEAYIVTALVKGIPSLFSDLKSLYADPAKKDAIEEIVERLREHYKKETAAPSGSEEPTTYLWTLYLLAQHYSSLGKHQKALELLEEALEHTPTLPELHTFKGRVLKRAGDYLGAARCVNDARVLDGQDRFLNTKTGKYLLRAGMVKEASNVLGLFTKKDASSPGADLEDMQSMLYLLEEARAHEKNGHPNLALKKYMAVKKIYDEIEDDQYDFHGYCLRKFTLNAYVRMLKWEDNIRGQASYVTAALAASKIFVAAHDNPNLVKSLSSTSEELTDAAKKAKKKAKKAAVKAVEEKKNAPTAGATHDDKGIEPQSNKDDDPDGLKLLGAPDVLDQAAKVLAPLTTVAAGSVGVWCAVYDVAVRRGKVLQAVSALGKAKGVDAESPEVHVRIVDLKLREAKLAEAAKENVKEIFVEGVKKLYPGDVGVETFNSQYLQRGEGRAESVLACARVLVLLGAPQEEVDNAVFELLAGERGLGVKDAVKALEFLRSVKSAREEDFRAACDARFELSTAFKSKEEQAVIREGVMTRGPNGGKDEAVTP
ncbi:NMDA receptor-regulated protein 1a [Ephemerocybe angulata]|uniref:NMDA receptor-regulated protein 1a n=1 Tax=Ephemerocybe angulata TaxID=980116 RepID=A0A8H6HHL3_9AGAR|nr:NMDA receptor-regulated protein 1a [Tulosesus angulatus]